MIFTDDGAFFLHCESDYNFSESTYGTVYQTPASLLHKLSPLICDGTRTEKALIFSDDITADTAIHIPVDKSIKQLHVEISGTHIETVIVESPDGASFEPIFSREIDFSNLKYYRFENVTDGSWSLRVLGEADHFKITVSAFAKVNFEYSITSQKDIMSHTIHKDAGSEFTIGSRRLANDEGSNFISNAAAGNGEPVGEMKLSVSLPQANFHRIRRTTKPIFTSVSRTNEVIAGRTNVFFFRVENAGEALQFSAHSTNPQWQISISPEISDNLSAVTDLEVSIIIPRHTKPGASAQLTLSASNGEMIVGSSSFFSEVADQLPPRIASKTVRTKIENRFAKTVFEAVAVNSQPSMADAPFRTIIPAKSFLTAFSIVTADGQIFHSKIVPAFEQPMARVKSAGVESTVPLHHNQKLQEALVVDSTKNGESRIVQVKQAGQHLMVRASVEAFSNLTFVMEYVEVLERTRGSYRFGVHFDPEFPSENLKVQIMVQDENRIKFLQPIPRQSALVRKETKRQFLEDYHKAAIEFTPSDNYESSRYWFGIEFDVEQTGCSLFTDSQFFVQRCRPVNLFPAKLRSSFGVNAIFLIDSSGSMMGERMEQTREAFKFMIEGLKPGDTFNIVSFESVNKVFSDNRMVPVNDRSMFAALKFMDQIQAGGATDVYAALVKASLLLSQNKRTSNQENIIYFLTDGAPTAGVTNLNSILDMVDFIAQKSEIVMNTIAYGEEANDDKMKDFLTSLSARSQGMVLRVPARADAQYMMQDFFLETLVQAQKRHGIRTSEVRVINEAGKSGAIQLSMEDPYISPSREVIIGGQISISSFESSLRTQMDTEEGLLDFDTSTFTQVTAREYFNAVKMHNLLIARENAMDYFEHLQLTKIAETHSLASNLLTPVTSLQIRKPGRDRRSTDSEGIKELKFKFRQLRRPSKNHVVTQTASLQEEKSILTFSQNMVKVIGQKTDFCFGLRDEFAENEYENQMVLLREKSFILVASVLDANLEKVELMNNDQVIFAVDRNGPVGFNLAAGDEFEAGNGRGYVLTDRVVVLLDDGVKFELVWGGQGLTVNLINASKNMSGIMKTLLNAGESGEVIGEELSLTHELPVKLSGFYTVGNNIQFLGKNCLYLSGLADFLNDAEQNLHDF
ncbi:unnamed protein product [Oikopleura dioica]|uniref:VWFA domain-containing protein n=1 Tax=Oikopleura dioica TaxID=34765 RepID=E4Y9H2_OIKDI|nr:unnamed protein product [Oikopleura dioica]